MAHQWFGDLVTAINMTNYFVNEALASAHEYGCLAAVLPAMAGVGAVATMHRVATPPGRRPGESDG